MNTLRFNEIVFMNFYMIQRVNRKVQNTDILTPTHHSIGRSADKKLTPYDLLMHASHGERVCACVYTLYIDKAKVRV